MRTLIPYIGITGFTNFSQVQEMLTVFSKHRPLGTKRRLHVGALMSYKTLHGIPTPWERVFAPKKDLARIFASDKAYNCLHYVDYEDRSGLARSISLAIEGCGICIDAIQLDMLWPNPGEVLDGVDRSRKPVQVILQVGRGALDLVGNDPERLVEKLGEYKGVIHRVLLDKSGGEGRMLNAAELLLFMRAIRKAFPELGMVVAGGLGPDTLHLGEPIFEEFPDVSIDAQKKLQQNEDLYDPLSLHMSGLYLERSLRRLK